jgi:hypothetical protein
VGRHPNGDRFVVVAGRQRNRGCDDRNASDRRGGDPQARTTPHRRGLQLGNAAGGSCFTGPGEQLVGTDGFAAFDEDVKRFA